jgi:hypothetical protein
VKAAVLQSGKVDAAFQGGKQITAGPRQNSEICPLTPISSRRLSGFNVRRSKKAAF